MNFQDLQFLDFILFGNLFYEFCKVTDFNFMIEV